MDRELLDSAVQTARNEDRELLLETEGLEVLRALGIAVPAHLVIRNSSEITERGLAELAGEKVVLKIVAPGVAHKSEEGGLVFVAKSADAVRAATEALLESFGDRDARGVVIYEEVPVDRSFGGELLVSLSWNREFGPVLHLGPGGLDAELFGREMLAERALAAISPRSVGGEELAEALDRNSVVRALTEPSRGRPARASREAFDDLIARLCGAAEELLTGYLDELEINPMVPGPAGFIALDVLARRLSTDRPSPEPRPLEKIGRLLEPSSIALVGASRRFNPGRLILRNILREGFDPQRIHVIKKGLDELDGCACVPDLEDLPGPVDLLIVSVAAAQVPELLGRVVAGKWAESVIVIPGGLDEKSGGETLATRMRRDLEGSRKTDWQGPVVNGGNCLGIRSRPGRYDTMFLPDYKLAAPDHTTTTRAAMISQSGAFLAARASKLAEIGFKYAISVGNQIDLTIGDYLEYLSNDPNLELFAVYVEGFKPLDGLRFLDAAARIRERGGSVVLYRAGRSRAGVAAAASHTAAMAGDYAVTSALASGAGVQVARGLADFEDLVELHYRLGVAAPGSGEGRRPRLAAMSNAGFECVAMGDNIGQFELARFSEATTGRLGEIFERCRIAGVVDVRNPLDLTPMAGDEEFVEAARAVLEDDGVDAAVVGCVPLTGALTTLPPGPRHGEDLASPGSVVSRLIHLRQQTAKPWVAVVDAGSDYDPMARLLRSGGVPTFRSADRALEVFGQYCRRRFGEVSDRDPDTARATDQATDRMLDSPGFG